MLDLEMAYRDFESVEAALAAPAQDGGHGLVLLLAPQKASAALAREQECAAIEAEDVLSQAEEALVMG